MQTQTDSKPLYHGFIKLIWAWLFTTIITLATFWCSINFFSKPETAMMATLTVLALVCVVCLRVAWLPKTSKVWQYTASLIASSGAVFSGVGIIYFSGYFVFGILIFFVIAFGLMFINLHGDAKQITHEAYLPIHTISAVTSFMVSYFYFLGII